MKSIKPHSHEERKEIIQKLLPVIQEKLAGNFIALAADGSFARNEDIDYSDLELIAFVKEPLKESWEIRKIVDGLLIVVVVETKESYISKYLDVSNAWYASGAGKLLPIINKEFIDELNNFKPQNIEEKCLQQIEKRWPHYQEITAKVLNAIKDNNKENFSIIFYEMIKELLVVLSYLNMNPYITLGKYITQAKEFKMMTSNKFISLMEIATNGRYDDLSHVENTVKEIFSHLESMLEQKGLILYSNKI